MMNQNNPVDYAKAIQYQLADIVDPIPVYANFNRNFAKQARFITWQLRNIHQPVYTGGVQRIKGIDRPIFQISIFAQSMDDAFNMSDDILQSLHGYSGQFGGPSGFFIAKADVFWLYNSYDDELKLHQIFLDCTIDVPA
jgi:hypothetical protein